MPFDNKYYRISSSSFLALCCNEIMFKYTCRKCGEDMGCYYCSFNYDEAHECDEQLSTVTESYPHPVGIAQEYAHACAVFDSLGTIHSLDESPTRGELAASPTIGRTMFSGGYTESNMG